MTRKIIIDTDPGQDDAVAILLAMASPELEVMALVVVAGNVPLDYTRVNARKVLELAGRPEIPVYVGCDRPLRRKLVMRLKRCSFTNRFLTTNRHKSHWRSSTTKCWAAHRRVTTMRAKAWNSW